MTGFGNNCVFEKIQQTKQVLSPLNCAWEVAVINLSLWFLYIFLTTGIAMILPDVCMLNSFYVTAESILSCFKCHSN